MPVLPEPTPTAPAAGQTHNPLTDSVIKAAVDNAIHEMRRDSTAPPARKPERPAMSEKATDVSVIMTAAGFLSLCLGTAASAVMHFSGGANETVVICLCATPPATLLALGRLFRRAKEVVEAAPAEQHHHYSGDVYQDLSETHTENNSVWAKNDNRQ